MSTCRATRDAILGMDLLLHERSGWRDLLRTQVEESVQVVRPSQQVGAGYPFPAAHPGDVFTGLEQTRTDHRVEVLHPAAPYRSR